MERIVLKCLEKEPENRYQSAKELGVDLRHLGAPHTVTSAAGRRSLHRESRRALWPVLAGVSSLIVAATAGAYFYFHRAPKLTEKDSIVVADFANSTGDPCLMALCARVFPRSCNKLLSLASSRGTASPKRCVLWRSHADTPLTDDVARQICQRVNATAVFNGSVAALGNQYVLGLDALNCSTGEMLTRNR